MTDTSPAAPHPSLDADDGNTRDAASTGPVGGGDPAAGAVEPTGDLDEVSSPVTDLDPTLPVESLEAVIDPTTSRIWTRGDSIRVAIALAALLVSGLLALDGVSTVEIDVFERVNTLPAFLYVILWPIMQLGNVWVAMSIAAAVGIAMRRWRVAAILAMAPLLGWYLAKAVKAVVERGRPDTLGIAVNLRGGVESGYGYISGHATVSFALAGAIAAHLRKPWSTLLFVGATIVAIARLYVGVHLPLDVIGGAACGLLIGELARVAEIHRRRRDPRPHRWLQAAERRAERARAQNPAARTDATS